MASESNRSRASDRAEKRYVVARSPTTGRFLLKPASKRGSISIQDANTAVRSVSSKKGVSSEKKK
jgi:hypothetical protein